MKDEKVEGDLCNVLYNTIYSYRMTADLRKKNGNKGCQALRSNKESENVGQQEVLRAAVGIQKKTTFQNRY